MIDTSIIGRLQPVQIESPVNALAKMMQVQNLQQTGQMNALKMDEYRRGLEDQNQLRSALSAPGADPYSVLLQRGNVKEATEFAKGKADLKKSDVETENRKQDTKIKQYTYLANVLKDVKDQTGYQTAYQLAEAFGMDMNGIPTAYDPRFVETARGAFTTEVQKWTDQRAREQMAETGRHNLRTEGISAGQLAETKRHHGVTEGNQATTLGKPFEVTGPDGVPILVRQDKQGNISRVEGFGPKQGAAGAGTEGERNAAGYASRMSAAEKLIETAARKDPKAQKPGFVEQMSGGTGMPANLTRSETRQEYRQAQEDWVRAKLRKESGAAIPNDEMEREISVYFPQIGDKLGVVAQKAAARKVAEQAMKQSAGRALKPANTGGATGDFGDDPLGLRNGR